MNLNELALHFLTALRNWDSEDGQTLAEYGLIISVVAVAVMVLAVVAFRGSIIGAFDHSSNCINAASQVTPSC